MSVMLNLKPHLSQVTMSNSVVMFNRNKLGSFTTILSAEEMAPRLQESYLLIYDHCSSPFDHVVLI